MSNSGSEKIKLNLRTGIQTREAKTNFLKTGFRTCDLRFVKPGFGFRTGIQTREAKTRKLFKKNSRSNPGFERKTTGLIEEQNASGLWNRVAKRENPICCPIPESFLALLRQRRRNLVMGRQRQKAERKGHQAKASPMSRHATHADSGNTRSAVISGSAH
jgi:hypothetical protein